MLNYKKILPFEKLCATIKPDQIRFSVPPEKLR